MLVINYSGKSLTYFTRLIVVLFKTCNYRLSSVCAYCQSFININPADNNWQEVSQNQKTDPVTGWSISCLLKPGSLKNGPGFLSFQSPILIFQQLSSKDVYLNNLSQNFFLNNHLPCHFFITCIFIFKECKMNTPVICSRYHQCRQVSVAVSTRTWLFLKTHFILPTV